ncbi:ankyrin repeat domain-containing protein [Hyphococcus flavus]|uniref:Ankyrin repeat domain-containing protein n=1 Tax=Hyphococcus flavus TaxID=1866326 RepID=A0AAF0CCC1_9PROT|nr:ankyrin repeat domain-containing protein [Hyphococcus flavus]WDI33130.1 ankyrin repeat domain-containing protein [Hyphococcus flavus]
MGEIHTAAYNGWADEVSLLLNSGVSAQSPDEKGFTPLHWAAMRASVTDQTEVISSLIAAGADPDALSAEGYSTPLVFAVESGNIGAVKLLITLGAKTDLTVDNVTALMIAARNGNKEIVKLLVGFGAEVSKKCESFTAADYAFHGGHNEIAEFLIGKAKSEQP